MDHSFIGALAQLSIEYTGNRCVAIDVEIDRGIATIVLWEQQRDKLVVANLFEVDSDCHPSLI